MTLKIGDYVCVVPNQKHILDDYFLKLTNKGILIKEDAFAITNTGMASRYWLVYMLGKKVSYPDFMLRILKYEKKD